MRKPLRAALRKALGLRAPRGAAETTPGVRASARLRHAEGVILDACDGFLRREAIRASLTADERREILRGMLLTRATDNRLKAFFTGGEVRHGSGSFQGKGFRSLRPGGDLRLGDPLAARRCVPPRGRHVGRRRRRAADPRRRRRDRDAARPPPTVRMILNGQMGKQGPPMNGKDLHIGDFDSGVLPASAPLTISTMTVGGLRHGVQAPRRGPRRGLLRRRGRDLARRVARSDQHLRRATGFPRSSASRTTRPPYRRRSTIQSAARVFAEKAAGYGIPGITIDGTDPDAIASAFAWAAERAREGAGPTLIELIAMRMCGHAHHDDMLYLGRDPSPSWEYAAPTDAGYADAASFAFWAKRDPIPTYAARLLAEARHRQARSRRLEGRGGGARRGRGARP